MNYLLYGIIFLTMYKKKMKIIKNIMFDYINK